jgi:hypothetical protein
MRLFKQALTYKNEFGECYWLIKKLRDFSSKKRPRSRLMLSERMLGDEHAVLLFVGRMRSFFLCRAEEVVDVRCKKLFARLDKEMSRLYSELEHDLRHQKKGIPLTRIANICAIISHLRKFGWMRSDISLPCIDRFRNDAHLAAAFLWAHRTGAFNLSPYHQRNARRAQNVRP